MITTCSRPQVATSKIKPEPQCAKKEGKLFGAHHLINNAKIWKNTYRFEKTTKNLQKTDPFFIPFHTQKTTLYGKYHIKKDWLHKNRGRKTVRTVVGASEY